MVISLQCIDWLDFGQTSFMLSTLSIENYSKNSRYDTLCRGIAVFGLRFCRSSKHGWRNRNFRWKDLPCGEAFTCLHIDLYKFAVPYANGLLFNVQALASCTEKVARKFSQTGVHCALKKLMNQPKYSNWNNRPDFEISTAFGNSSGRWIHMRFAPPPSYRECISRAMLVHPSVLSHGWLIMYEFIPLQLTVECKHMWEIYSTYVL